jgi:hypothetical protein
MSYDSAAGGALAVALSILLGVVTFYRRRSRGLVAGLRGAGWTLLPLAAWLTGVLELAFEVGQSVGDWAVDLVFKPSVWLGIVLAGVAGVLFGAAALLGRRRADEVPGGRAPALERAARRARPPKGAAAIGDDVLGDIEAILRKHGIS